MSLPAKLRFGGMTDAERVSKFAQKADIDVTNATKMYLVIRTVPEEYNFTISDYINPDFSFVGNIAIVRKSASQPASCAVTPGTSSWTADSTTCPMLGQSVVENDWFLVTYTVQSPGSPGVYSFPDTGNFTAMYPY